MKDSITLEGMEFYGRHGVLPEENVLGQRFIVDLSMNLDLSRACTSDNLSDTVNYAAVYDSVRKAVEGEPVKLLECLANNILATVFRDFPLIEDIRIVLHKPGAPIKGVFKDVKIKIKRSRSDYVQE